MEPALRCIESLGIADVIHKDVATRAELEYYLDLWLGKRGTNMPGYQMGIFEFHGTRSTINLGSDDLSLSELADIIDGRAFNRVLFFGGCEVLAGSEQELKDFCRRTRAKGIVGFTKTVDFLETTAFEMVLLDSTLGKSNFKPIYTRLVKEHPKWTKKLGLRMAHGSWASDRTYT